MSVSDRPPPLGPLRKALLVLLLLGLVVTGVELLLIGHDEDGWQRVPLVLLALAPPALAWWALARSSASRAAFRLVMGALVAGGALGGWLHYDGNAEFELEMYPSLAGSELFAEAMTGATPALAPLSLIQLGLLGLLATWRVRDGA